MRTPGRDTVYPAGVGTDTEVSEQDARTVTPGLTVVGDHRVRVLGPGGEIWSGDRATAALLANNHLAAAEKFHDHTHTVPVDDTWVSSDPIRDLLSSARTGR